MQIFVHQVLKAVTWHFDYSSTSIRMLKVFAENRKKKTDLVVHLGVGNILVISLSLQIMSLIMYMLI